MVACAEKLILDTVSEHSYIKLVHKDNTEELESKLTTLETNLFAKKEILAKEKSTHEKKVEDVNKELSKEKKQSTHLKEYAEFNKKNEAEKLKL